MGWNERGRPRSGGALDQMVLAYAMAFLRFSSIDARKSCVVWYGWSGPTRRARSLVILPRSRVSANLVTSGVPSILPRYDRPCVQAKIDAIGLVDVGLPFWCSR